MCHSLQRNKPPQVSELGSFVNSWTQKSLAAAYVLRLTLPPSQASEGGTSPLSPGLRPSEVSRLLMQATVPYWKGPRTPRQQPGQDMLIQAKSQERRWLSVVPETLSGDLEKLKNKEFMYD